MIPILQQPEGVIFSLPPSDSDQEFGDVHLFDFGTPFTLPSYFILNELLCESHLTFETESCCWSGALQTSGLAPKGITTRRLCDSTCPQISHADVSFEGRAGHSSEVMDGRLLVFGGWEGQRDETGEVGATNELLELHLGTPIACRA